MVTDGDDCPAVNVASAKPCDVPVTPSKLVLYNETTVIYLTNGDIVVGEGQSIFDAVRDECGHHTENVFIGKFNVVSTSETEGKIQTEIYGEAQEGEMVVQAQFYVLSGDFEIRYDAEIVASTEEGVFVSLKTEDGKLSQAIFMDEDGTLNKIDQYNEDESKEFTFFYENGKITKAVDYNEEGNEVGVYHYNEQGEIYSYEELEKSEGQEEQTTNPSIENDVVEPVIGFFDVKDESPDINGNGGKLKEVDGQAEIKVPPSCSATPLSQMAPISGAEFLVAALLTAGGKNFLNWLRSLSSKKPE